MNITLQRINRGTDSTIGSLFIGAGAGLYFHSFTCEDEQRNIKVRNETRIPAGRYEIKLRTEGGFHAKYSNRYPKTHKGMLWLQDVPNFEWSTSIQAMTQAILQAVFLLGIMPLVTLYTAVGLLAAL